MLRWILANKDNITWICASIGGTFGFFLWVRKVIYFPVKRWVEKLKGMYEKLQYELNNNGGKSMKDLSEKTLKVVNAISANMDGLLTTSPDCIFKCDETGALIFANESLCDLYGASRDELEGFGFLNFIRHDLRATRKADWKAEIENSRQVTNEFVLIHGITGEEIPVEYKATIKRDDKGNIISIFGIVNKKC